MEYFLFVCIVLFLTYLGYYFSAKYRERKRFFQSWTSFHKTFLSEIQFTRRPIDEILENFSDKGEFFQVLRNYLQTRKAEEVKILTSEENALLEEYCGYLGKTDAFGQNGYFSSVSAPLAEKTKKSEEEAKKYTDLFVKLGFLAGLVLVIILV